MIKCCKQIRVPLPKLLSIGNQQMMKSLISVMSQRDIMSVERLITIDASCRQVRDITTLHGQFVFADVVPKGTKILGALFGYPHLVPNGTNTSDKS